MGKNFNRLTSDELHEKLDKLQLVDEKFAHNDDLKWVLHELQVHQLELEMQNRELKESRHNLEVSHNRYSDLYDFAPVGFLSLDQNGVILELNLTAASLLEKPRGHLLNTPIINYLKAGQGQALSKFLTDVRQSGWKKKSKAEFVLVSQTGVETNIAVEGSAFNDPDQKKIMIRVAMLDITDQVEARGKLNSRLQQAAKVFDCTLESIVITDSKFKVTAVNQAFSRLTGYSEQQIKGSNFKQLQIEDDEDSFPKICEQSLVANGHWQGEVINKTATGKLFTALQSISSVFDEKGKLTNYVIVFTDISDIKESQERINFLAYHDPLTRLPNRTLFNAKLEHAVQRAKRHQYQFALLFLDLDRFKYINDTLGHKVGDILLQQVSERIQKGLREEDSVARLGGDEFVILLENLTHPENAAGLAEKLINALVTPITVGEHTIRISTSIGISIYPKDALNAEDLVKAADAAMYHAKRRGKHTFRFYSPKLTAKAFEHLSVEHGLTEALAKEQFFICYQPIKSLKSGLPIGLEALVRWQHPEKGVIMPDKFIPVAEETGAICDIGLWVIKKVCRQIKIWQDAGIPTLRMCINVSARQVMIGQLAENIQSICQEVGLSVEQANIELEITESVLLEVEKNISLLKSLHDIGVRLAIDDFGTGYSSLSNLKHFPIDTIKIDRSFISDLSNEPDNAAIVEAIVALAHSMRLEVIAEGVETIGQREFVASLNCDLVQGYGYCRPMPIDQVELFLQEERKK